MYIYMVFEQLHIPLFDLFFLLSFLCHLSGRLLMLSWRCSTSCCGTTSPSPQTLCKRWWSYRESRSRPTSPPDTASCSTCSTTHPCWCSASACWRREYASWTPMHSSLVREHMLFCTPRMRDCLCVCVCSDVVLCYSSPTGKKHLESAVLHCLRLLDLALQKEVVFMDLLRESQASLLVSPLEQLLQGVSPQTRKADHIVNIAR